MRRRKDALSRPKAGGALSELRGMGLLLIVDRGVVCLAGKNGAGRNLYGLWLEKQDAVIRVRVAHRDQGRKVVGSCAPLVRALLPNLCYGILHVLYAIFVQNLLGRFSTLSPVVSTTLAGIPSSHLSTAGTALAQTFLTLFTTPTYFIAPRRPRVLIYAQGFLL